MTGRTIVRTYLAITGVSTLSSSLIWGINTLFLFWAGLDIFGVMLVNAAFTVGQMVFEVPTGVVADTVGRRASYLLSTSTLCVATLLYMWVGLAGGNILLFAATSLLLGLAFTFYSGAVDAWMVDALDAVGYEGRVDAIFARAGIVFGITMLVGTTLGGVLGQVALWIPYVVRALLCIPAILVGVLFMKELGFKPRPLKLSRVGAEMSSIGRAGIEYGVKNPVVRPLMLATLVGGLFGIYGFYSWPRYFLDLLGMELIWVSGVIAAFIGLSQIVGNLIVGPLAKRRVRRSTVLIISVCIQVVAIVGAGLTNDFYVAVTLYVISGIGFGVAMPTKAGWLNECIPSEQRATIISLDSLFGNAGGTVGQLGLGYLSRIGSISAAWVIGGTVQLGQLPFLWAARKRARVGDGDEGCGPETPTPPHEHEPVQP